MRVETFFCYCFLIIVLFYFNITILFILPAGNIDFLEFYISFAKVFALLWCNINLWIRNII